MLLPKNSILWRPLFAAMMGVILGPVAMFLMLTFLFEGRLNQVNVRGTFYSMMLTAAIVGGSFAYVSARLNRCENIPIAPRAIKRPVSLTARTIAAASIAWLIGIPCLFLSSSLLSEYQGTFNTLRGLEALPFIGLATAGGEFPTCVGFGLLLFSLLPKTSLLWRPFFATITGVILGPVAMFLFFTWLFGGSVVEEILRWNFHQAMLITSAIIGGSFAYVSAILNRRAEKASAASP